jgi:hypothetical protein
MQIRRRVLVYTELVECSDVTDIDRLGKIYNLLKDRGNGVGITEIRKHYISNRLNSWFFIAYILFEEIKMFKNIKFILFCHNN